LSHNATEKLCVDNVEDVIEHKYLSNHNEWISRQPRLNFDRITRIYGYDGGYGLKGHIAYAAL
jgi:hypothetical protein